MKSNRYIYYIYSFIVAVRVRQINAQQTTTANSATNANISASLFDASNTAGQRNIVVISLVIGFALLISSPLIYTWLRARCRQRNTNNTFKRRSISQDSRLNHTTIDPSVNNDFNVNKIGEYDTERDDDDVLVSMRGRTIDTIGPKTWNSRAATAATTTTAPSIVHRKASSIAARTMQSEGNDMKTSSFRLNRHNSHISHHRQQQQHQNVLKSVPERHNPLNSPARPQSFVSFHNSARHSTISLSGDYDWRNLDILRPPCVGVDDKTESERVDMQSMNDNVQQIPSMCRTFIDSPMHNDNDALRDSATITMMSDMNQSFVSTSTLKLSLNSAMSIVGRNTDVKISDSLPSASSSSFSSSDSPVNLNDGESSLEHVDMENQSIDDPPDTFSAITPTISMNSAIHVQVESNGTEKSKIQRSNLNDVSSHSEAQSGALGKNDKLTTRPIDKVRNENEISLQSSDPCLDIELETMNCETMLFSPRITEDQHTIDGPAELRNQFGSDGEKEMATLNVNNVRNQTEARIASREGEQNDTKKSVQDQQQLLPWWHIPLTEAV